MLTDRTWLQSKSCFLPGLAGYRGLCDPGPGGLSLSTGAADSQMADSCGDDRRLGARNRPASFRIRPSIPAGGILRSNRPGSFGFIVYDLVVLGAYIPPTGGEGYGLWPSGEWLPDAAKKFISKWEG